MGRIFNVVELVVLTSWRQHSASNAAVGLCRQLTDAASVICTVHPSELEIHAANEPVR